MALKVIIFTPTVELKDELAATAIIITCYDRNGNEVKRVTSTSGEVEDPEQENTNTGGDPTTGSGTESQGGDNGGSQGGGTNPDDDDSGKN